MIRKLIISAVILTALIHGKESNASAQAAAAAPAMTAPAGPQG